MPYATPNTFVANTVISAPDIQENLDAIQVYLDGGIAIGDLAAAWVDTKHLMRGFYNPISNQFATMTGVTGGESTLCTQSKMTILGSALTGRVSPTAPADKILPGGSVSFYLEKESDVIFQCWITEYSDWGIASTDVYHLYIYLDSTRYRATRFTTLGHTGALTSYSQRQNSEFVIVKGLSAGEHSFSLRGYCYDYFMRSVSWGVSFEAYYL